MLLTTERLFQLRNHIRLVVHGSHLLHPESDRVALRILRLLTRLADATLGLIAPAESNALARSSDRLEVSPFLFANLFLPLEESEVEISALRHGVTIAMLIVGKSKRAPDLDSLRGTI